MQSAKCKINPSVKTCDFDSFSSRNRHPFVCFADISPNRGITFQGRQADEIGQFVTVGT